MRCEGLSESDVHRSLKSGYLGRAWISNARNADVGQFYRLEKEEYHGNR